MKLKFYFFILLLTNYCSVIKSDINLLPNFFRNPFNTSYNSECSKHSKIFLENLDNGTLWAYESKYSCLFNSYNLSSGTIKFMCSLRVTFFYFSPTYIIKINKTYFYQRDVSQFGPTRKDVYFMILRAPISHGMHL